MLMGLAKNMALKEDLEIEVNSIFKLPGMKQLVK